MNRELILCAVVAAALVMAACASGGSYPEAAYRNAPMTTTAEMESGGAGFFGGADAPAPMDADGLDLDRDFADHSYSADDAKEEASEQPSGGTKDGPPKSDKTGVQRVILYEAQMGLYVFKIEETLEKAVASNKELGGWVQASTSTSVTLRVPAANFEELVTALSEMGDINYKNVVGTDVTEEYLDIQIRLKNAEVLRKRLVKLLQEARTVEDSLAVEKELARVTGEIERFKGRLRYLKNRATFSVVTLTCEQKTSEPVTYSRVRLPFGWLRDYSLDQVLR